MKAPSQPDTLDTEFDDEYVSRTAAKKEVQAITAMGIRLIELSDAELDTIPLTDTVKQTVLDARSIKSFTAKKRQQQYLGKLLRKSDVEDIEAALNRLKEKHQKTTHIAHQAEHWRDRLLSGDKSSLSEFLTHFPDQEVQPLRQIIRQAQKEQRENKPPAHARKLFRWVREVLEQQES